MGRMLQKRHREVSRQPGMHSKVGVRGGGFADSQSRESSGVGGHVAALGQGC